MKKRVGNIERIGIHKAAIVVEESLNWIFRNQPIADVGIDAQIEEVIEGTPTGRLIACQIKSGASNAYLNKSSNKYSFYINKVHYAYWAGMILPVIIILYDEISDNLYWEAVEDRSVKAATKGWKIELTNKLNSNDAKADLCELLDSLTLRPKFASEENDIEDNIFNSELINDANSALQNLNDIQTDFAVMTNQATESLERLLKKGKSESSKPVKLVVEKYSNGLKRLSKKQELEITNFSEAYKTSTIAMGKIHKYLIEKGSKSYPLFEKFRMNCELTLVQIERNIDIYLECSKNINMVPGKSRKFKTAKRMYSNSLLLLVSEMRDISNVIKVALENFKSK